MTRKNYEEAFIALEIGSCNEELLDEELDKFYEAKYKSIMLLNASKLPQKIKEGLVKKLSSYGEALTTIKQFRRHK